MQLCSSSEYLSHTPSTLPCGQINFCGQKNASPKPEEPLSVVRKTLGSDGLPVVKKTLGSQKNPSMLGPEVRKTLEGFSWPQGKVFPTSACKGQKNPPLKSKKHAVPFLLSACCEEACVVAPELLRTHEGDGFRGRAMSLLTNYNLGQNISDRLQSGQ